MKNKTSKVRGITLIALVVTIVILLILAAVTISFALGRAGILKRAENARDEWEVAALEEQKQMDLLAKWLDSYDGVGEGFDLSVKQVNDSNPGIMEGTGTQSDPFVINSIDDLMGFSAEVSQGNNFESNYIKLGQTLDFNSSKSYVLEEAKNIILQNGFDPIGSMNKKFSGNFDGNKCAILNLKTDSAYSGGLFGVVGKGSSNESIYVKNILVTGNVKVTSGEEITAGAGIIGACTGGTIQLENLNNAVNVTVNANKMSNGAAGGIVGIVYTAEVNITNCTNTGEITLYEPKIGGAGSIIGISSGTAEVDKCSNAGNMLCVSKNSSNAMISAGGIVGKSANTYTRITNCSNVGNSTSESNYMACSGGIIGDNFNTEQTTEILNCSNIGNNSATSTSLGAAGGIVGGILTQGQEMLIQNCSSVANNVVNNASALGIGGIIGTAVIQGSYNYIVDIENTYHNQDVQTIGYRDNIQLTNNSYTMPQNVSYNRAIVQLEEGKEDGWTSWTRSKLGYPILGNSGERTTKSAISDFGERKIVRTETLDNIEFTVTTELVEGLDETYITIKPSQYYKHPSNFYEYSQYLTEDEKWQTIIDYYNAYTGNGLTTKEELCENLGVETEEELFSKGDNGLKGALGTDMNINTIDDAMRVVSASGVIDEDTFKSEEYIERYNENVNSVYEGISVSFRSNKCVKEESDNYGYNVFSVKENGQYTFDAFSKDGSVLTTQTVTVNNLGQWSMAYSTTATYTDSNGDKAVIPAGFKVSLDDEYNKVRKGLLVQDSYENIFVWIPCSDLPNAVIENRFDQLYDITDNDTEEYRALKASVTKNGGFYVGRYETSLVNGRAASIRSYNDSTIHGGTWQELYNIQKRLYENNEYVKSAMMWGGQYRVVYSLTQKSDGTTRDIGSAGADVTGQQFHIYDLYANLRETSQAILVDVGGKPLPQFHVAYGACSVGLSHYPNEHMRYSDENLNDCFGSRLTLYINN